jgi:hypothetical protein
MSPIDRLKIRKMVLREMHEMGMDQMPQDHMGTTQGRVFHDNAPGEETGMIKSNLFTTGQKAHELHDMINDYDDLPEWVQEKIAVIDSMMGTVHDYLKYEYHKFNSPQMPPAMSSMTGYMDMPMLEGKKKNGRVVKGKYHGETYKAATAMARAIEKGASYEELKKMAKWSDNPDAVVNAALMAVKGKPTRKNEG